MEAIKSIGKHYKVTIAFIVSIIYILITMRFYKASIGSITFGNFFNDTLENGTTLKSKYPKVILATKLLNLENILEIKNQPTIDGTNIFFIEALHVLEDPPNFIGLRQACSFESAARANPHMKIYIVFVSAHRSVKLLMNEQLMALLSYPNVNIVMAKLRSFAAQTPAGKFILTGGLRYSKYPVVHTSDVFRFLLLWKYSGTYMDSDMIVRKSIDELGRNYACADGERGIIANAFLNFDAEDGRKIVENLIHEQINHFNPIQYGTNGPVLLTNQLIKMCGTNRTQKMIKMDNCDGFHVHSRQLCYPILPTFYKNIFNESYTEILMQNIKNAVTVHMWNGLTFYIDTTKNDRNFYTELAKQYCPKVFDAIDSKF
ncbi:hypothetical protein ACKWTF_003499 [Chironomus riparius]